MTSTQTFKSNELINFLTGLLRGESGVWSNSRSADLKIAVDLPGIDPDEVCLSFAGDTLTIGQKDLRLDNSPNSEDYRVVAVNSKMQLAVKLAEQLAKTVSPVIICGEHGTGKDLFAGAIHHLSEQRDFPIVTLPCGTLGDHGVKPQIDECLATVGCGTLFLDGVHDLTSSTQEELFGCLSQQEKARIISATDVDLDKQVAQGLFSADLMDTLRGGYIELPPLRARREDIKPLAIYHIVRYCRVHGIETKTLSPDLLQMLHGYRWPGNVRELVNTLEQLILTAQQRQTLFPKDLPDHIRIETIKSSSASKQGL